MIKPQLNPPCAGWKRDLPGPNEPPEVAPTLRECAPNYLDDTYLELSRRSSAVRGLLVLTPVFLCPLLFGLVFRISDAIGHAINSGPSQSWTGLIIWMCATFLIGWYSVFLFVKADVLPPRDLPIRFNRARRRIYVYDFHMVWWNPFTRWYVTTASYPWDDVRAELWEQWGVTSGGGLMIKWGVSLAIVKPGTNDVIERFHLSTYNHDLDNLWAYVCTYMQQGPQALPPCDIEPRDANDVPAYNLALRWAPRVEWPEAMDWESRSSEYSRGLEGRGEGR